MKGTYKGHDQELGAKFMQEYSGSVIGVASAPKKRSEPELNQYQDLQEQYNEAAEQQALERQWAAKAKSEAQAEIEEDHRAGKQMMMGRAVQNVQLAMRAKGKDLGAVSAKTILAMSDRGEIEDLPSVQALRRIVAS